MQIKRNPDGTMLEVGNTVRIERGPKRRTESATPELLSNDVTALHYQAGQRDALGKVIEIGAPMHFIDWLASPETHAFTVYQLQDVPDVVDGKPVINKRFMPQGEPYATEELALSAAIALAMA